MEVYPERNSCTAHAAAIRTSWNRSKVITSRHQDAGRWARGLERLSKERNYSTVKILREKNKQGKGTEVEKETKSRNAIQGGQRVKKRRVGE
jgi:hypothetical protein